MIETEHRASDSPYVARVWLGRASGSGTITAVAASTWSLVFLAADGVARATARGPQTTAATVRYQGSWESFGIDFAHGTHLAHIPAAGLIGRGLVCPVAGRRFRLRDQWLEIPRMHTAELFVERLVRSGMLVRDPLVDFVVRGGAAPISARSVQRRVIAATGQTKGEIQRIERARSAAVLLADGVPALEVVHRLGFYDQPHLARSLRRFIGRTATGLRESRSIADELPLLYAFDTIDPEADEFAA